MKTYTQETIRAMAESALNAACADIQQQLGVTDGGFASLWFCGEREEMILSILSDYITAEIQQGA